MVAIQTATPRIVDSRHPSFLTTMTDWEKFRLTYRGGEEFRDRYLERFSDREDDFDYRLRQRLTPIPSLAKSAVQEIRSSIFQRLRDITRSGGSENYRQAVNGLQMGVDRRGSSMDAFLGMKVLEELLVMGRVGVYVDMPQVSGPSLADAQGVRPYLYPYQIEDILSWSCTRPEEPSEFQSVLLRDTVLNFDPRTLLPLQTFERFRMLWINKDTGQVNLQFYDAAGNETDRDGQPSGPIELELTRIPFVMPDIGDSLLKDICHHQIALLNLASRDVFYAIQANFSFYVEQRDMRPVGSHLKTVASKDGTATSGGQGAAQEFIDVGATTGRAYGQGLHAPAFINPSPEPLEVSMKLQDRLEAQIRKLVNLAVSSLSARASAESKAADNSGLEAGLSFIGLQLENAERRIADHWAAYEERNPSRRQIPTIKYPDQYKLKTDDDRIEEATKLAKLMFSVPGRKVKREISKQIVVTLFGGRLDIEAVDAIVAEIQSSDYLTSNPDVIIEAVKEGLCGEKTGSMALGFSDNEYLAAREDHLNRVKRLLEQQQSKQSQGQDDPAARGAEDLSEDPADAGAKEKAVSRDNTLRSSKNSRVRGKAAGRRVSGKQGE